MADRVTIRFVSGPLSGQTFSIGPGELFYVGSDPACGAILIGDPTVAEKHICIFYRAHGKILVKDLATAYGSRMNGKVLGKTSKMRAGDRITVGGSSTFQCSQWDPLQQSRMTGRLKLHLSSMGRLPSDRFSGRDADAAAQAIFGDLTWRSGNRVKTIAVAMMTGLVLALGVFVGVGALENHQRGIFKGNVAPFELRALTPTAREAAPQQIDVSVQLQPDRNFIWDEIVNISVRFGETPPSIMDEAFIAKVQMWISRFTRRGFHKVLLQRRQQYIAPIEAALREQNLPLDLGYLVWIESAYETHALSSAGARGLWQLMPATAREYGLRVDLARKIDERVEPVKSSRAAAAYLNLLIKTFGSQRYLLAIASYNTGQNRVQRYQIASTIKQSRVADFWHLVDQLPDETVDYVPKFLAAVIVARNPDRF